MLDKINIILHKKFQENCDGNPFELREDAPDAKCKTASFEYKKNEGEVIAYKFDKEQEGSDNTIFPFFVDGVTHLKKMCDFILFYKNKEHKLFVILCNLKSDAAGSNEEQMRAAEVFVNFVIKTIERLYPTENSMFELKKVYYRSKFLNKNTTNPRNKNRKISEMHLCSNSNKNLVQICNLDMLCRT